MDKGNPIKAIIFDCFGVLITDPLDTVLAELGLRLYVLFAQLSANTLRSNFWNNKVSMAMC